jgi:CHAT domain-containing protein
VAERYALTLAPSATIAARLWARAPSTADRPLLAFGAPRFPRRAGLLPLPASASEVRTASRSVPGATLRLGAAASESYLKAASTAQYHILHFATHALVDDESLDRTALVLSAGDGQDGLVSPAELAALRLDADLVVLSGCRTARGVVFSGEGVQGLANPLLAAGTRSVLATLWSVGDRDAARLVGAFYREVAGGATVGDALAKAKRAAITRGDDPAVWAAFVLVGNPSVRPPLPPADPPGRWWSAALVVPASGVLVSVALAMLAWSSLRRRRKA